MLCALTFSDVGKSDNHGNKYGNDESIGRNSQTSRGTQEMRIE